MSVEALLCSSCGAALAPQVLETKVKCQYCGTIFVIVRDHQGIRGVAADGAPPTITQSQPASQSQSQSDPPFNFGTPVAGIDPRTVERLERDAVLAVRGLEAAAETAVAARGLARVASCGCLSVVFFALSLATIVGVVVAR